MAEEFTCAVPNEKYRSACKDLPKYSGSRYCVLHEPDESKNKEAFEEAKKRKLDRKDYDFSGAIFPEGTSNFAWVKFDTNTYFTEATFIGGAQFVGATFSGRETYFRGAQFSGGETNFQIAKFSSEDIVFQGAKFSSRETSFQGAQFSGEGTFFQGAKFSSRETDFRDAQFSGRDSTSFTGAQFSGGLTFFQYAQFSSREIFFERAKFSSKRTYFEAAQFSGEVTAFQGAQFSSELTSFLGAHFSGRMTSFVLAQFGGERIYFGAAVDRGASGALERASGAAQFRAEVTSFNEAKFSSRETDFEGVQFSGEKTIFSRAQFSGERTFFNRAHFSSGVTSFEGAQFRSAETDFQETTFVNEVAFTGATFSEKVAFWGSKANPVFGNGAWVWFNRCRIDKPEQFTLDTVLLHPRWFINTDVRKVDFTDVKWYGMPGGPEGTLDEEISALEAQEVESPHTLLSQTCRRLSTNAEENREYPLANEFYHWSMDALRKEGWRSFGPIRTLYWALSGYGVRAARAFWVLVAIWAVFTILYILVPSSPFSAGSVSDFGEATVYSLGALARLNPEPRPNPGLFQLLVTVEGLIGPLQIGLLLLAIRRRVMR